MNNRELKSPNPTIAKKLNVDNFRTRNTSVHVSTIFDNDTERFDESGAVTLMQSKNT